ncbi:hybrid sensor histidine kinase/response regulator [Sulfurimonas sp. MAG313]|nr:hybrid sensor histidine kinase/response regulator [Sulfurimonas sp. MAG313]MDF1881483.1 hybrid sensor histidine kinase/response regulator [Sulfurimonas sp. MAG313]
MLDKMVFASERNPSTQTHLDTWKLFIVDDDADIHEITKLALKDLKFKDKYIDCESAYSAKEAIQKLKADSGFAIVLLDVEMETSDAGLEVANFIREQLQDKITRIIIRTGQPGDVPQRDIIDHYDINDFKSKTDLTIEKLFTTIRTAIAQYDQIHELASLNEDLEKRIQEALNLQQKQQETLLLQDRTVQMGELLNMLAHQWRQPLSRIAAVTTQLKLSLALGEINQLEFDKQVSGIEKYTHELSETINEFREIYEPTKFSENIPLCSLLEKSVSIINSTFKNNKVVVDIVCDKDEKGFFTSNAIFQVILSILRNSEEAFAQVAVEKPRISISTQRTDEFLLVLIQDNAGGIKEEHLLKVFDPYFSTKDKKNGHGLGLYMSKNIVEQSCDGKLSVENKSDGALFTISLPIT